MAEFSGKPWQFVPYKSSRKCPKNYVGTVHGGTNLGHPSPQYCNPHFRFEEKKSHFEWWVSTNQKNEVTLGFPYKLGPKILGPGDSK